MFGCLVNLLGVALVAFVVVGIIDLNRERRGNKPLYVAYWDSTDFPMTVICQASFLISKFRQIVND